MRRWAAFVSAVVMFISALTPLGLVMPSDSAMALSSEQSNMFAQNNILFYDPTDYCGTEVATKPTGIQIIWVSGKLSEIESSKIKSTFSGIKIDEVAVSEMDLGKGIAEITSAKEGDGLRKNLIIALSDDNVTEGELEQLMNAVGPETNVIISTMRSKRNDYAASNAAIVSAKTNHKNLYVADWATAAKSHLGDWFDASGELNESGVDEWLKLIKEALPVIYTTSSLESGSFFNEKPYGYTSSQNPYSHWTGNCTKVDTWNDFLSSQVEFVRTVAAEKGLPWEAMLAQAIQESGGGKSEIAKRCNNPLGLKGKGSAGVCDERRHAKFNSFEDAWRYYADRTTTVKRAQGKFSSSPYSFLEFIQYGLDRGSSYAQCSSQSYINNNEYNCGGHQLGDPTPGYVATVSALVCGIQKWAVANGVPISTENYATFDSVAVTNRTNGDVPDGAASDVDICKSSSGVTRNNGDINSTALALAWPMVNGRQDRHSPYDPSPAYKAAMEELGIWQNANGQNPSDAAAKAGGSCDVFVYTVMVYSGADLNFPIYLGTQRGYLKKHTELYDSYSASAVDPQPGDIRIENNNGHIVLIVKKEDGKLGIASASHFERSGDINNYYYSPGTIYRLKGAQ